MKIRFKIASTIMSMCLALVVMGFAVWAASTQTLPVVNTVDFTSIHVLSTVTGTVTGAKAETFVNYGPVSTLAGDPEGKLGTWAIGSAMEFANETEPIIITLTVVNNSDERSLSFELSGDSFGEFNGTNLGGTNIDRTCVYSINNATPTTNATYTSGAINVEALKTATIVMTLDISDNGKSVTAFDNSFSTTLRNVDGTGGEESFSFNPETKTLTLIEGSTLTEENLPDMYSQDESEPAYYGLFEDQAYTQKVELPYSGATTLYAKFEETPTNLNLYLINDDSEYGVSKNETTTGDVVIPEKYNRKKITEISDFTEIENLTSIYIPKFAVIQDNSDPFYLCPNLANIFVSSSNSEQKDIDGVVYSKDETILVRCPQAKTGSYTIPSTVETLFYDAFALCSELTSITIPTSVTSIGDYAFESCTGLTSLDLSENMIESLGAALFYGCSSLNNIILPNTLIEILDACFFSCSSLISITIPTTVTFIGQEAFSECSSLNQVIINSETIANSFDDETSCGYLCGFVTEVCILDSISTVSAYIITEFSHVTTMSIDLNNYNKYYKQLNNYAFSDGSNELATYSSTSALNWDNLPEMSVDGKPAFYGLYTDMDFTNKVEYPYSGDATTLYARFDTLQTNVSLTLLGESYSAKKGSTPTALVEIPERFNWLPITTLPDFAFYCWSLDVTNIFVPDTVTNVGRESFMGCDNLTNVTMSKNLTTIGLMGLENCKGLKTISLAHIENIGNWAFDGCSDLQSITIPDCTIGENVFFGCNSLTEINVADSLANYSTQDGVLYNKDKTTLIRYPSKKIG
ncbi:MAG: leucine-rich repeat domain-containing protein, partial [Clostridia bacterium]